MRIMGPLRNENQHTHTSIFPFKLHKKHGIVPTLLGRYIYIYIYQNKNNNELN